MIRLAGRLGGSVVVDVGVSQCRGVSRSIVRSHPSSKGLGRTVVRRLVMSSPVLVSPLLSMEPRDEMNFEPRVFHAPFVDNFRKQIDQEGFFMRM